jgi:tRNA (guanine-N7-)-methyltransferase
LTAPSDRHARSQPLDGHRTYLRRRGRTTRAQARALEELSGRYCLAPEGGVLDPGAAYGRSAPWGLEIGFGMGQALVDWALERPDWNLLGVEVYQPGIGSAMLALERHGVTTVRLLQAAAEPVLEDRLASSSLDEVRIFFPDPWPKKRHHKRRLLQAPVAALLADRLRPGGLLWLATDWEDYGRAMVEVLDGAGELVRERAPRVETGVGAGSADEARPRTRFESRGRRLGHAVWDLRYRRKR